MCIHLLDIFHKCQILDYQDFGTDNWCQVLDYQTLDLKINRISEDSKIHLIQNLAEVASVAQKLKREKDATIESNHQEQQKQQIWKINWLKDIFHK